MPKIGYDYRREMGWARPDWVDLYGLSMKVAEQLRHFKTEWDGPLYAICYNGARLHHEV